PQAHISLRARNSPSSMPSALPVATKTLVRRYLPNSWRSFLLQQRSSSLRLSWRLRTSAASSTTLWVSNRTAYAYSRRPTGNGGAYSGNRRGGLYRVASLRPSVGRGTPGDV